MYWLKILCFFYIFIGPVKSWKLKKRYIFTISIYIIIGIENYKKSKC